MAASASRASCVQRSSRGEGAKRRVRRRIHGERNGGTGREAPARGLCAVFRCGIHATPRQRRRGQAWAPVLRQVLPALKSTYSGRAGWMTRAAPSAHHRIHRAKGLGSALAAVDLRFGIEPVLHLVAGLAAAHVGVVGVVGGAVYAVLPGCRGLALDLLLLLLLRFGCVRRGLRSRFVALVARGCWFPGLLTPPPLLILGMVTS